jgi:GAF domain-containing protein
LILKSVANAIDRRTTELSREEVLRARSNAMASSWSTRRLLEAAVDVLAPLAGRMAMAMVADVLPDAHTIDVHGEMNEDWLPILRIRRIRDADGRVLFDVSEGHEDPIVENAVDTANTEYLDLLVDLTGDEYLGNGTIESH